MNDGSIKEYVIKTSIKNKQLSKTNTFKLTKTRNKIFPKEIEPDQRFRIGKSLLLFYSENNPLPLKIVIMEDTSKTGDKKKTGTMSKNYSDSEVQFIANQNFIRQIMSLSLSKKDIILIFMMIGVIGVTIFNFWNNQQQTDEILFLKTRLAEIYQIVKEIFTKVNV